ncbi:MAG: ATP-binding protein [Lachnospiraceae bacterium]|nr:ATP-binding protein [Lachnospiraceae bacterium]
MFYLKAAKLSEIQDAFNPNPLQEMEEIESYYQDVTEARTGDIYSGFVEKMELLLEDSHNSLIHKLFVGHAGVGKTTELYRLKHAALEKGFLTCFGRCDIDLDSGDIEYTDVLLYILDLLVMQACENHLQISERIVKNIENYWNTDIELSKTISMQAETEISGSVQAEAGVKKIVKLLAGVRAILKNSAESKKVIRTRVEPRSSELIAQIREMIEEIRSQLSASHRPDIPFVILDGLDKIPLEQARKIFMENGSRFQSLQIHLLVTFPISLSYTPEYKDIQIWFPNPAKLPMIKLRSWQNGAYVKNYAEGKETLKNIVRKRADLSLFAEDALDELITYTGGYLRDLFRCICDAALRARLRKSSRIELSDAKKALEVLESDINGRYGEELIGKMQEIYRGEKYVSSSEEITTLLQIGAVLEYNGTRWCDLHPLVEKWLIQNKKITK